MHWPVVTGSSYEGLAFLKRKRRRPEPDAIPQRARPFRSPPARGQLSVPAKNLRSASTDSAKKRRKSTRSERARIDDPAVQSSFPATGDPRAFASGSWSSRSAATDECRGNRSATDGAARTSDGDTPSQRGRRNDPTTKHSNSNVWGLEGSRTRLYGSRFGGPLRWVNG